MNSFTKQIKKVWKVVSNKAADAVTAIGTPEDKLRAVRRNLEAEVENQTEALSEAMTEEKKLAVRLENHRMNGDEAAVQSDLFLWKAQKAKTDSLKHALKTAQDQVERFNQEYTAILARMKTAKAEKAAGVVIEEPPVEVPKAPKAESQMRDVTPKRKAE